MKITSKDINSKISELADLPIDEKISLLIKFIDEKYGELSTDMCEKLLSKSSKLFSLIQHYSDISSNDNTLVSGNLYHILDAYDYLRGEQEYIELGVNIDDDVIDDIDLDEDYLKKYDSDKIYIKSLTDKPLTAEEEKNLAIRMRQGDEEARNLFIKCNMRLVVSIVRRYRITKNISIPFLDLVEEGNMGMIKAADKFDPNRGRKFSTYATHYIMQAINAASNSQSSDDIIFPRNFYDAYNKYKQLVVLMNNVLGREVTNDEIAKLLNVDSIELEKFLLLKVEYVSLNKMIGDGDDTQLLELIPDTNQKLIYEENEQNELKEELIRIIKTLPSRESSIIFDFFYKELTMKQIAIKTNLSHQRIQQIISKTLNSLRNRKDIKKLAVYLNEDYGKNGARLTRVNLRTYKSKVNVKSKKKTDEVIISKLFERMKKACIDLQNGKYTKDDLIIENKIKTKK